MAQPKIASRLGIISASLWENGDDRWPNVTLTKRYRTDDEWKNSTCSLSLSEVSAAIACLTRLQDAILAMPSSAPMDQTHST